VSAPVAPETVAIVEAAGPHVPPLLERIEERLAQVAGAHGAQLAEHAGSTIAAGGKRLRPLLVLVAAGGVPEDGGEGLVRAGAAVELVHSATLVHDDVLDRAALRRGQPTVVAVAGRASRRVTNRRAVSARRSGHRRSRYVTWDSPPMFSADQVSCAGCAGS